MPGAEVPPGSQTGARSHWGSPGTWEIRPSPDTELVPPSEGNEARREGRSEVGALRSTEKAGERLSSGPRGGKGEPQTEPMEGKMKETQGSENISTKLQRIAELARQRSGVALTTLAHHARSPYRQRIPRRGVTEDPQGRSSRRRRTDGERVRGAAGSEPRCAIRSL